MLSIVQNWVLPDPGGPTNYNYIKYIGTLKKEILDSKFQANI